jgi:SHS2 domain-containing protein
VRPLQALQVVVEADDRADLMVRWLSELNFLHVTEGWLFCAFDLEERTDRRLVATVRGERIHPGRHVIYTEIKAVTYHGLEIRQDEDGWHAQVIFDL